MARTWISSALGALTLAAWMAGQTPADQVYHPTAYEATTEAGALHAEVASLRAELDMLRGQMNSNLSAGHDGCCRAACGTWGGFEPCCHSSGFWFEAEALFLKYYEAGGVDLVASPPNGDTAEFDFEASPRFTLGYVRSDGLGVRARYWEYNHDSSIGTIVDTSIDLADFISIDTYTIDLEVFDTFALNPKVDLEVAGGIRYNEFARQHATDGEFFGPFSNIEIDEFSGVGGMLSAEARRKVGDRGALFARARHVMLVGDKDSALVDLVNPANSFDFSQSDCLLSVTEIALGYQYTQPLLSGGYWFAKAEAEWQNWQDYLDDNSGGAENESAGLFGFGGSIGLAR